MDRNQELDQLEGQNVRRRKNQHYIIISFGSRNFTKGQRFFKILIFG
jgi:hypothetical protein